MSMSRQAALKLQQPASVALYDDYADAQRAVDYLAEHHFPVQQLAIVGTDLRSLERVTGQLTNGRVLVAGFSRGIVWAFMFAVLMWVLGQGMSFLTAFAFGVVSFGLASALMAWITYRSRGGSRDFTSRTTIIAGQYEVLSELDVVDRARHLLSGGQAHPTIEAPEESHPVQSHPVETTTAPAPQAAPDLASFPPPFGQQPVDTESSPMTQAPNAPENATDASDTAPPAGQVPGNGRNPATGSSSAQQPYGSYWGASDEPGIGTPPKGFDADTSQG